MKTKSTQIPDSLFVVILARLVSQISHHCSLILRCGSSMRSSSFLFSDGVEQELELLILNVQLGIHFLMFKLDIVEHLVDADEREALPDELGHLTDIELRSLINHILNLLFHDLLCQWLLELDSLDHAFEVRHVRQLLLHLLHFMVQLLDLVKGELANVLVDHERNVVVDDFELWIILLLF